jgi:hypothetical protein
VLDELIQGDEVLGSKFHKVFVMLVDSRYTLIPEAFFKENTFGLFLETTQKIDSVDEVLNFKLKNTPAHVVFAFPKSLYDIIGKRFYNPVIANQLVPLVDFNLSKNCKSRLYVECHSNFIDIALIDEKNILLANSFPIETENDILYHLVNVCKQQEMKPIESDLELTGSLDHNDKLMSLLKEYFPKVKTSRRNTEYFYSYTFSTIDEHKYTGLFNLMF